MASRGLETANRSDKDRGALRALAAVKFLDIWIKYIKVVKIF